MIETQRAYTELLRDAYHRYGRAGTSHRGAGQSKHGHVNQSREGSLITLDPEEQTRFEIKSAQVQTRVAQRMIEATGSVEENETRSVVWVQANVYEKGIRFVREGGNAEVRVGAQPDRVFKGKMTHVSDVLDAGHVRPRCV